MTTVKHDPAFDPETEWLDHVRPTGLVVAKTILKELGATPLRQTALDSEAMKAHFSKQGTLADPWAFFRDVLGWQATHVAGAPGGPALPETLSVSLPEHETVLAPTWAVRKAANADGFQLLVQILPPGIDPDGRGALRGWEARAHQRFERLLRESQVFTGLLLSDHSLRLVYAPAGETSGWLAFPIAKLATVAGRPMLAGLKLLLNRASLFTNPDNKRLTALLKASREAQAGVSQELAAQVLGALHELLRGLHAADRAAIEAIARQRPGHLYEGLLTVLMRLVFLLYAEDRDLLPSHTDADSRTLYENYSVRDLLAQLADDSAQNPDTMDERVGGWGRLLALFRLIHAGDRSGWIVARGGKLFDPDIFPFLEGRTASTDAPHVLAVSDGSVLRILRGLMILRAERLSYRGLDVEQIGSVYETVIGFTVETAKGPSLAIRAGKSNKTPVFVDCAALAKLAPEARQRHIKDTTGRATLPAKTAAALRTATDAEEIVVALGEVVDDRGSPGHTPSPAGAPLLQPTDERRRTGSHYTPRSLTEPIVRQALTPALERLGADATPAQILDLKVCDPAMGSGAFLVEACRQLGQRLVQAWARPGPKPAIPADEDEELHARRLVAQRCLYGVDRNPMATDLARLSLWLATLARDHEFTFLDHALKTGDSLVGLTRAQIAALRWDAGPGHAVMRYVVRDRFKETLEGRNQIRDAPDDVSRAIQEQRHLQTEIAVQRVRDTGNAVISAFFSADRSSARETRRAEIESWFAGNNNDLWNRVSTAAAELRRGPHPLRPFHWELEFPEVFASDYPGFDTIVGNPPFAGKNTVIASNPAGYHDWLVTRHVESTATADLAAHFFRLAFSLIRSDGTFGLIATNTIREGDTRRSGLRWICLNNGAIYSAQTRYRWPGEVSVVVSIVHVVKGTSPTLITLNGKAVSKITAFLFYAGDNTDPAPLSVNAGKSFQGSILLGMGFTFDDLDSTGEASPTALMRELVQKDSRNAEIIRPYIGGEEVNDSPSHQPRRYAIDFFDRDLTSASRWPDLLEIVRNKVKPVRDRQKRDANRERWWQYAEKRPGLYHAIRHLSQVLVISRVRATGFAFMPTEMIFSEQLVVFPLTTFASFAVLQSRVHECWARFFSGSALDLIRYSPSSCFETFPLPVNWEGDRSLEAVGKEYYDFRSALMLRNDEGLTKTYNRFHSPDEHDREIQRLRELHAAQDRAVLAAYGWQDIKLEYGFLLDYEVDDEEMKERRPPWRLRWPDHIRDEVIARLLELNGERAAIEAAGPKTLKRSKRGKRGSGFAEGQQKLL